MQWERLSRAMNKGDEARNADKSVRVHSRPAAAVAASARSEAAQMLGAELNAAACGRGLSRKPSIEERKALMDAQRERDAAAAAAASAAVMPPKGAPKRAKPTKADKEALLNAQREGTLTRERTESASSTASPSRAQVRRSSVTSEDADETPDAVASLMTSFGEAQLAQQLQAIAAAGGAVADLADDGGGGGDDGDGEGFDDDEFATIDEDEVRCARQRE